MQLRQAINDRPMLTAAAAAGVILAVLAFVLLRGCAGDAADNAMTSGAATRAFFTTDDGKTYFADAAILLPPFAVNKPGDPNHGKLAWGARVAQCRGAAPFVWAVEKYGDAEKRRLQALIDGQGGRGAGLPRAHLSGAYPQLKKPGTGDKGWVKLDVGTVSQYDALARPQCPDGGKPDVLSAE